MRATELARDHRGLPALVACLCAEWCTACRAYRAVFDLAAAEHPGLRFAWVDIEDQAALFDGVEVENFPTLLIGAGDRPRFYEPIRRTAKCWPG